MLLNNSKVFFNPNIAINITVAEAFAETFTETDRKLI